MQKTKEVYVVFDIESDGPCPGLHSMLSLGACVIGWDTDKRQWASTHTFGFNLMTLPHAYEDPDTMQFWAKNPSAWVTAKLNPREPADVMKGFITWLRQVKEEWSDRTLTPVAGPAAVDYGYLRWYMIKFLGTDKPLGHSCLDIKTLAAHKLGIPYREAGKSAYHPSWFADGFSHTHVAVEDARETAWIFSRIIDWGA